MSELLKVSDLHCAYGDTQILKGLSLSLEEGEIACLLGPSGCGKTTALRAIAGFIDLSSGSIELSGQLISKPSWSLVPEKRSVGMVFQDYALFPHLSIAANIAFGLSHLSNSERDETVLQMLELINLTGMGSRYPHELSGGQQQRVALVRALAPRPQLLLMDEPFSNLDADLRRQLSSEMRRILKHQGIAAIMVTHDQQEAFTLSDKLGVLIDGSIKQWGTPQSLFYSPASPEVASFVSQGTLLLGTVDGHACVKTELGLIEFAEPFGASEGEVVQIFLRPMDLELTEDAKVIAEVDQVEFQGSHSLYHMKLSSGQTVKSLRPGVNEYRVGDRVGVKVATHRPVVFLKH